MRSSSTTTVYLQLIATLIASSMTRTGSAKCGRRPVVDRLVGRIVGGQDAFYGQVPWQAMVKESQIFGLLVFRKCGAVLINEKWALTAAHCNAGWFGSLVVVLGEHDLNRLQQNQRVAERKVKRVVIHPNFSRLFLENDIALVELEEPVTFDDNVQPICLPSEDDDFTGQNAYVSGWGYTEYRKGALPDVLKVVKLPILSNGECRRMYKAAGYPKSIKSTVVCAGFAAGGKDSCEGDSGGPLMVYSRTRQTWVLAGIVSNGIRCAEPNLPGIYTRPTAYLEWINSVMKGGNELDADKLG